MKFVRFASVIEKKNWKAAPSNIIFTQLLTPGGLRSLGPLRGTT